QLGRQLAVRVQRCRRGRQRQVGSEDGGEAVRRDGVLITCSGNDSEWRLCAHLRYKEENKQKDPERHTHSTRRTCEKDEAHPIQLDGGILFLENKEIARLLGETADLMEIASEDSFRIRSYRNGATAVEGYPERIADILRDPSRKITDIPGIG